MKDVLSQAGTIRGSISLGSVGASMATRLRGILPKTGGSWGVDTPAPVCQWLRASQGC